MDHMMLARFNLFWFLWLSAPILLMWYATRTSRRVRLICCAILSLLLTYYFSNLAVDRKWDLLSDWADTPEALEIAQRDGANRVFTLLFLGPAEAVVLTVFWGVLFRWQRQRQINKADSADAD